MPVTAPRKLGRVRPKVILDTTKFKVVELTNGSLKVVPKFAAHYRRAGDLAPPPVTTTWLAKMQSVASQMYGNDTAGDCVIASLLKIIGGWTGNELGTPALSNTAEALSIYQTVCGPGDQGCVIASVLDYAQATGIPVGGVLHKIAGYAAVDWKNQNEIQVCCEVFGPALKLGINLPQSWYDGATADGFVWDLPPANDAIAGGHDVPIADVTAQGVVILTWGMRGIITWPALLAQIAGTAIVEECWVSLGPDWYSQANLAPNGIDAQTLKADLALVATGQTPPIGPPPVVPPVTPPVTPPVVPPVVPPITPPVTPPVVPPVVPPVTPPSIIGVVNQFFAALEMALAAYPPLVADLEKVRLAVIAWLTANDYHHLPGIHVSMSPLGFLHVPPDIIVLIDAALSAVALAQPQYASLISFARVILDGILA